MKLLMNKLPSTAELLGQSYENATSNCPELGMTELGVPPQDRPELKDWNEPSWEIYRFRGGHVVIASNRPTKKEVREGDLNGALGSHIRLAQVSRRSVRNALRIARTLSQADARRKILIARSWLHGIAEISTSLKLYSI